MGKFRKMLAGVLSAAMVLSTMTVTAFAAETKMPTINTTKKGSITINKYEGDDTTKPLEGVTFTIYKIADLEQGSNPVELKYKSLITGVNITSETKYNDIKSVVDSKIADGSLTGTSATTVMESGKATAKFTELDLGIYLVEETKAPSQVVNKTANFLVSVPMTNEDGDGWVYDITANPKNDTIYGGITLIKKGKTIKVDGTKNEENLKNVSFELQKYDQTTGWKKVNEYTTGDSGLISVTGLAPAKYRFIETNLGGKDDNKGYILDGKTAYEFTVQTDGKIKVGNAEASKSAQITVYNEKPSLEKSVENANGSYDNDTDASVGDTVKWKVEASVPSNVNELKTYKLTDKMSDALTWEDKAKADLKITTDNNTTLTEGTDYTLTVPKDNTAGGTWIIDFTEAGKTKLATNYVKVITVTFSIKLNEKAIIGSEGNLNDAELDYSNAIYPTEDPDNPNKDNTPGEDIIKDQAIVYSFQMKVLKVDGKTNAALKDVMFDLYSYTGTKTNPTEADLKGSDGALVERNLTTDDNGKIKKSGLKNGTYYLVETKTVKTKDGKQYNLLKEPVKVEIKVDYVTETETTITKDGNGNVTDTTTVSTKTFTGGDTGSDGTFTVTVKNYTGFDLPTTGGMGTVLFSIAGFALMAGAAFVLLKGRRKDA